MMRTNLNRCSRLLVVVIALTLVASLAAPAAGTSVETETVPDQAEVGDGVTATFTLTNLYDDAPQTWTLKGETELTETLWSVRTYDNAGDQVDSTQEYHASSFEQEISNDRNIARVEVTVEGTVPTIANYSYDPADSFALATFSQVREGGASSEIDSWNVHHFTEESAEARQAIDAASAAIDEASATGADVGSAERDLNNAIDWYDEGNFENAINSANTAEEGANEVQRAAQRNQLLLYGAIGLIAVIAIGGVAYWYRSNRKTYDKLG